MGRGRPRLSTIKMSPSFDKYTSNRIKQLQYALGKGGLTDKDERSIRDEIMKIRDDRDKFAFKKGGAVKKKRSKKSIDGIAQRGKTRGTKR